MKSDLAFLTNQLLKFNSIRIDNKELQFQIETSTDFTSEISFTRNSNKDCCLNTADLQLII